MPEIEYRCPKSILDNFKIAIYFNGVIFFGDDENSVRARVKKEKDALIESDKYARNRIHH